MSSTSGDDSPRASPHIPPKHRMLSAKINALIDQELEEGAEEMLNNLRAKRLRYTKTDRQTGSTPTRAEPHNRPEADDTQVAESSNGTGGSSKESTPEKGPCRMTFNAGPSFHHAHAPPLAGAPVPQYTARYFWKTLAPSDVPLPLLTIAGTVKPAEEPPLPPRPAYPKPAPKPAPKKPSGTKKAKEKAKDYKDYSFANKLSHVPSDMFVEWSVAPGTSTISTSAPTPIFSTFSAEGQLAPRKRKRQEEPEVVVPQVERPRVDLGDTSDKGFVCRATERLPQGKDGAVCPREFSALTMEFFDHLWNDHAQKLVPDEQGMIRCPYKACGLSLLNHKKNLCKHYARQHRGGVVLCKKEDCLVVVEKGACRDHAKRPRRLIDE